MFLVSLVGKRTYLRWDRSRRPDIEGGKEKRREGKTVSVNYLWRVHVLGLFP